MQRLGLYLTACSVLALASAAEAGETISYSYDSLGRLTRVDHSGTVNSGITAQYSYDPADNRTNVTVNAGPMVVGGGFETPDMGTGYIYRPTGSPASFAGNTGVAGNGSAWGFAAAPEGDQVAFIQGGEAAVISLQVTGLTPGASYKISFRISIRPGFSGIPVTLSFNGASLGTFIPPTTAFTSATSAAFTASAGSGTLTFSAAGGTIYDDDGIDLVSVAAVNGPPPPPPPNQPPVAVSDAFQVQRCTATTFDALANDSDPNGDALTITSVDGAAAQVGLMGIANNRLTWSPGYSSGTFTGAYTVSDGRGGTATGAFTVQLGPGGC